MEHRKIRHPRHLADRGTTPDDCELALVVVLEGLGLLARDQTLDLAGDVRPALNRGLGELRQVLRRDRHIAGGEDSSQALDLQVGAHLDAVAVVEGQAPLAHLFVGRDAGRPDRQVRREHVAVREPHRVRAHLFDAGAEPHRHVAPLQLLLRVRAQFRQERLQNLAALYERDAERIAFELGVRGLQALIAQLRQRSGHLDAGGPAADHDDRQAFVAVGPDRRALQTREQGVADRDGLRPRVHRERVLLRTRSPVVRRRHAVRDQQVVVRHLLPVEQAHGAGIRVDLHEVLVHDVEVRLLGAQAPQEVRDVAGVQPSGGHLIEQRLEGVVDAAVDEGHAHGCVPQSARGADTGEAAADDDDVGEVGLGLGVAHALAIASSRATHASIAHLTRAENFDTPDRAAASP